MGEVELARDCAFQRSVACGPTEGGSVRVVAAWRYFAAWVAIC